MLAPRCSASSFGDCNQILLVLLAGSADGNFLGFLDALVCISTVFRFGHVNTLDQKLTPKADCGLDSLQMKNHSLGVDHSVLPSSNRMASALCAKMLVS